MTIRLVRLADVPLIALAVEADLGVTPDLVHLATLIASPSLCVFVIDDVTGCFCRIDCKHDRLVVESLHPRSVSRNVLSRVLAKALREAYTNWPDRTTGIIEAHFQRGLNAQGTPDGGRELCLAWQAVFLGASVVKRGNEWYIFWTLEAARDAVQAL